MSSHRLAVRALNEYRKVDPLAYLSLRYTLNSTISIKDEWAKRIAPQILQRRSHIEYLPSKMFKQIKNNGTYEFRDVMLPSGTQMLAEAALIDACSKAGDSFKSSNSVYSYQFTHRYSSDGIYVPYFKLYSERQTAIGNACQKNPDDIVLYTDIKKFYPSITVGRVTKAWRHACDESNIEEKWKKLGIYLIDQQFSQKKGLLIGPLFSHLLANLLLKDLDAEFRKRYAGRYFRYVDDFAFVIPKKRKDKTIKLLKNSLKKLGLKLNNSKTLIMPASKWQEEAPYQQDYGDQDEITGDINWMHFIDHLKTYLLANPDKESEIKDAFITNEFRVPIPRYSTAIKESLYTESFETRITSDKFIEKLANLSIETIVEEGKSLKQRYVQEYDDLWPIDYNLTAISKKWKSSRMRYLIGRLIILGSLEDLKLLYERISGNSEYVEYSAMLESLIKKDATSLLKFGSKIAMAVAPPLAASGYEIICQPTRWEKQALEAYSALILAGVNLTTNLSKYSQGSLRIKASAGDYTSVEWSKTKDLYFREFFSLAKHRNIDAHIKTIQTPLDPDENWDSFANELLGQTPT